MGYISISLSNKALVQVVAPQWKNTQFQVQSVEMQGSSKELEKKKKACFSSLNKKKNKTQWYVAQGVSRRVNMFN